MGKQMNRKYHMGRFTDYENAIIRENWNVLCQVCETEQLQCLVERMNDKKNFIGVTNKRQRNVIGCYLGLNLVPARHGSDIFRHSLNILTSDKPKRRKFSREEDQIILNEVADKGDKLSTWKMLSRRIKGDE